MRLYNHHHGSSLILVLLVIAGILTVVFGAQRVTLVQFSQSNREEDNVSAYYAARAGIEDGLIRYRFSRDAETVKDKVYRYNLTAGASMTENVDEGSSIANYQPLNQYYDLSLNFKTSQINMSNGQPVFGGDHQVADGDFLELTGFEPSEDDYYLHYAFRFVNADGTTCNSANLSKALVQIEQRTENNRIANHQAIAIGEVYNSAIQQPNILISGANHTTSVRIRPYFCAVQYAFNTTESNNTSANTDPVISFDSLTATIKSVGYFGSAKRTLLATVNRSTGRLIDIYDFNALAGQNVQP